MVKLIMGLSGSGKTKTLVSLVHEAVATAQGDVVCIEKDKALTYDIPYQVRLIQTSEYGINSNELLAGFVLGLHAGNYDITHIFIDNFDKMLSDKSNEAVEKLLASFDAFSRRENVNFTLTASADPETATEAIRRYF